MTLSTPQMLLRNSAMKNLCHILNKEYFLTNDTYRYKFFCLIKCISGLYVRELSKQIGIPRYHFEQIRSISQVTLEQVYEELKGYLRNYSNIRIDDDWSIRKNDSLRHFEIRMLSELLKIVRSPDMISDKVYCRDTLKLSLDLLSLSGIFLARRIGCSEQTMLRWTHLQKKSAPTNIYRHLLQQEIKRQIHLNIGGNKPQISKRGPKPKTQQKRTVTTRDILIL